MGGDGLAGCRAVQQVRKTGGHEGIAQISRVFGEMRPAVGVHREDSWGTQDQCCFGRVRAREREQGVAEEFSLGCDGKEDCRVDRATALRDRSDNLEGSIVAADIDGREIFGAEHEAGDGCAERHELEAWARRLDEIGVSHGAIKDAPYGSGLSFRDPDGIALEFFAPPS
jgi:hypothetical protein